MNIVMVITFVLRVVQNFFIHQRSMILVLGGHHFLIITKVVLRQKLTISLSIQEWSIVVLCVKGIMDMCLMMDQSLPLRDTVIMEKY